MRLLAVILLLLIGSCTSVEVTELPVRKEQVARKQTLPQKCAHLLSEPDPATWDEVKEEYPVDGKWADCMGVGKKSRIM